VQHLALALSLFSLALSGCSKDVPAPPAASAAFTEAAAPGGPRTTWLFVGDSLTAGLGVGSDEVYTAHVARAMADRGLAWTVRNAGVSGDTTAGVLRRIDWLLTPDVHTAFLVIGGNDGLRGLPVEEAERNLDRIAEIAKAKGVRLVLGGMKIPTNYGAEYTRDFEALFPRVAARHSLPLMPFFLDGVGGVAEMNQPDGIHPNAKGHALLAERVMRFFDEEGLLGE
jgi:acyl-CoA thioesterase-1